MRELLGGGRIRTDDPVSQKIPEEDDRKRSVDLRGVVDVGGRSRDDHKLQTYNIRVV